LLFELAVELFLTTTTAITAITPGLVQGLPCVFIGLTS
jgi:hypothetical protein